LLLPPRVLPVTPGVTEGRGVERLISQLKELVRAGAGGVLLREPALSDGEFLRLAKAAREVFVGGWLGVHDRVHVAAAAGADAVHLGFRSLSPGEARSVAPAGLGIGHSHHATELELREMAADYRFLGPIHRTPSKEGWVEPMGVAALDQMGLRGATWAIGGIGPEEVGAILDQGVAGVAAIGSVFGGGDGARGLAAMLEAAARHG
jgi:thiamine-phosphate diphosphorylase